MGKLRQTKVFGTAGSGGAPLGFGGSPVVTVTAINVSGGIAISRSSGGEAVLHPCVEQRDHRHRDAVDGWQSVASRSKTLSSAGTSAIRRGREIITLPTSGAVVNLNNSQVCPEAVYVYRTPSPSYTITLTIRGKNGAGYTTATVATTVSVGDWVGTWTERWADSAATGANDGTSPTNAFSTIANINTFIGDGSNHVLHVKAGSYFGGSVALWPWQNWTANCVGLRIDTYGVGASPIFEITSGATIPAMRIGGSVTPALLSDFVVSGITFKASGAATYTGQGIIDILGSAPNTKVMQFIYLDRVTSICTIADQGYNNATIYNAGSQLIGAGVWNSTFVAPPTASWVHNKTSMGIYLAANSWIFVNGTSFVGGAGSDDTTQSHHIYPDTTAHALFGWNSFGDGLYRSYCINGNTHDPESNYWAVTDNSCTGVNHILDTSGANNEMVTVSIKNVVEQRNAIFGLIGLQGSLDGFYSGKTRTYRDNRVWGNEGGKLPIFIPDVAVASNFSGQLYRNKIYIPVSGASGAGAVAISSVPASGGSFFTFVNGNPVISAPSFWYSYPVGFAFKFASPPAPFNNSTWYYVKTVDISTFTAQMTLSATPGGAGATITPTADGSSTAITKWNMPWAFAYNTFVDARTSGVVSMDWTFADMLANGSYVDFNGYYSVAGQSNLFADNGTPKTFAQWKKAGGASDVWDVNGSVLVTNPWPNPVTRWSDMD